MLYFVASYMLIFSRFSSLEQSYTEDTKLKASVKVSDIQAELTRLKEE